MTKAEQTLTAAIIDLRAGRMTLREYSLLWFRMIDDAEQAGGEVEREVHAAIEAVTADVVMGRV